jgi:hypothetical protein
MADNDFAPFTFPTLGVLNNETKGSAKTVSASSKRDPVLGFVRFCLPFIPMQIEEPSSEDVTGS